MATLSGKYSDLGVEARNGVMLAVKEINCSGKTNTKKLKVVYKNAEADPHVAIAKLRELKASGINIVIGPTLSTLAVPIVKWANENGVILLSPTVSTSQLTGKKDNFFRIIPDTSTKAKKLGKYVKNSFHVSKICAFLDIGNEEYTLDFLNSFLSVFDLKPNELECLIKYNFEHSTVANFTGLHLIMNHAPDLVVIATPAIDAAIITQLVRNFNPNAIICANNWAKTEEFILNVGPSMNRIFFEDIDPCVVSEAISEFKKKYFKSYGQLPSFAAMQGYDSVKVLYRALKISQENNEPLRKTLTEIRDFPGILSPISIDEYGDCKRPTYICTIENGQFIPLSRQK